MSYRVFFGWVGLELAGYVLAVVFASDEPNSGCTGLCFSDQGLLVLFAMTFGVFVLGGQVLVGLLLTKSFDRSRRSPFVTGSTAFFITFIVVALVLTFLAVAH
ncbi:hypothetical protein [Streptomyces sp. SID13031]|uniref:hypothetical protein n=1 Tax=Streptomyces sp. SID13031 TaxID=2706046 RepID=UPI0013CCD22E|nr:hypothetical protein [Streptomyces sp. SID13031]NEA33690.1 hypothetical protein [Streptomyces sp. SID13031]